MKKPFLYAGAAVLYIVVLVFGMNTFSFFLPENKIIIPIVMLGLFVLSAAIMGFLFLSKPLELFLDNHKQEAVSFFFKIIGIFACFLLVFLILVFLIK